MLPRQAIRAPLAPRSIHGQSSAVRVAFLVAVAAWGAALTACSPSPFDPQELCDSADALVGATLVVQRSSALTVLEHDGRACEDGSCCNFATIAPIIRCGGGPDILLVPGDDFEPLHLHELECQTFVDGAPLVEGGSGATPCLAGTACGNWLTASATLSDELIADPIGGEPMRVLRVHELLSLPTR